MPGGVEYVGLRVRTVHETGNWLVITDCFNAFNQHCEKGGDSCGGGQLCASAHAVSDQML